MTATPSATRDSNIELLRIVSMIFIVLFHISYHGTWAINVFFPPELSIGNIFLQCLLPLGKLGVDIFVIITGYYLITSKKNTWSKIIKLWLQLLFYSVAISLFFFVFYDMDFSTREIISILTPFISEGWWFATTYLVLLALSPFINACLNNIDQKSHLKLILGSLILWLCIPLFLNLRVEYSNILWFVILYTIAAYIRKYPNAFNGKTRNYAAIAIVTYVLTIALILTFDMTTNHSDFWGNYNYIETITLQNSPLILIMAITLFLAFKNLTIGKNRYVNTIAATMFGVYLIHDSKLVMTHIYSDLFDCYSFTNSEIIIPYCFFMMACIFLICIPIEWMRMRIFELGLLNKIPKKVESLHARIDSYLAKYTKG